MNTVCNISIWGLEAGDPQVQHQPLLRGECWPRRGGAKSLTGVGPELDFQPHPKLISEYFKHTLWPREESRVRSVNMSGYPCIQRVKIRKVKWYLFSPFNKKVVKTFTSTKYEENTNASGRVKCLSFLEVCLLDKKSLAYILCTREIRKCLKDLRQGR